MEVRVVTDQPWDVPADVLVIPLAAPPAFDGPLDELDRRAGGELRSLAAFRELTGKRFETSLASSGELPAGRLLAVGIGDAATLDRESVVHVAASAERRLGGRTVRSMAVWLSPLADAAGLDGGAALAGELVTRGIVEGSYDPKSIYKSTPDTHPGHDAAGRGDWGTISAPPLVDELILVVPGGDVAAVLAGARRGQIIGEGANLARGLANRAANDVSPVVLAEEARALAEQHGLWIDVIEPERATELGMGMFMAIGRGSDNPPRMIVLRSGGEGERDSLDRHLALIGKGVCFDSGGISIKPSDRMEEMKMDKTGACTVIAAIATVARLAPGTPLLAVAPAVENMPGPHSTRPGDIVTALNGKTVDITNTDAEGRLILGDAMTYAEQLARCRGRSGTWSPAPSGHPRTSMTPWQRLAGEPASAIGSCRSWMTTCPRWTAGMPTSRTRVRPRDRSSRAACSCASSPRSRGSTWISRARPTSARRPRSRPGVPRARPTRRWSNWPSPAPDKVPDLTALRLRP